MASKFFERRSIRNQLKTYLELKGWVGMTWAEGFSAFNLEEIITPFIALILSDFGKDELEMGANPTINKIFSRRVQVYVYMESEDRVLAITDDISDFFDIEVIIIKDNNNNVLGSMISDTASIVMSEDDPSITKPDSIEWVGVVACMYDVHYPQG